MRLASLGRQETSYEGVRERNPFQQIGLERPPGGSMLRNASPHYHPPRCAGLEELEGAPSIVLEVTSKEPGNQIRYWLDPAHGHLPVKAVATHEGKPRLETRLTHIRECSNQRWFPERSITVFPPVRIGAPRVVCELTVLELDADRRPDAAEFVLTIPRGTQVQDQANLGTFFHLKQEEKIGLDELPAIATMLDRAPSNPLMDTAIPRPGPYRWLYRGAWLTAGIALLLGGAWLFLRRRFRRRAG